MIQTNKIIIKTSHPRSLTLPRLLGKQEILIEVLAGQTGEILFLGDFKQRHARSSVKLKIKIHKNAKLNFIESLKGGESMVSWILVELLEPGAECLITNMLQADQAERHNFQITMHHQAPETKGDILVKAVYQKQARGDFRGLIKVESNSQKIESFYKDDILLLDKAQAISNPTLEITANDVKASHSSTIANLNPDQIFYLRSRGLNYQAARDLLVAGFFVPALSRLPQAFCQPFLPKSD